MWISVCAACPLNLGDAGCLVLLQLFETGVDEMSWDDLSQARNDWPTVEAAHAYRVKAYKVTGA